jgi:uncharacterized linocin/CFP29 family protein
MSDRYLNRETAPLTAKTWELLDHVMVEAAKSQLLARRMIPVEGPYGLGVRAMPLADVPTDTGTTTARFLPLQMIFKVFSLSLRDVAAFERDNLPLDTSRVALAAMECARAEDALLFHGTGETQSLLVGTGVTKCKLTSWKTVGRAAADITAAVVSLDEAGFHGPYALALVPERYNALFRRYPDGNDTEMEHLSQVVTGGIHKAPALNSGGVLLATGAQFSAIVLGQDMNLGFIGQVAENLEFSISESLALHLREPKSVCVLEG